MEDSCRTNGLPSRSPNIYADSFLLSFSSLCSRPLPNLPGACWSAARPVAWGAPRALPPGKAIRSADSYAAPNGWTNTRTQPIAVRDALSYLTEALRPPSTGEIIEIGGADVTTYSDSRRYARVRGYLDLLFGGVGYRKGRRHPPSYAPVTWWTSGAWRCSRAPPIRRRYACAQRRNRRACQASAEAQPQRRRARPHARAARRNAR